VYTLRLFDILRKKVINIDSVKSGVLGPWIKVKIGQAVHGRGDAGVTCFL
jgi:hypothetical protein